MCEYQKFTPNIVENGETVAKSAPICTYTKERCTYCICGNGKTYEEAKRSEGNA